MGEYFCAEICIGGKLKKKAVPKLCQAITQQGVSLEWGDKHFEPGTAEDLLEAIEHRRVTVHVTEAELVLRDTEASYGEFPTLEETCRKLKLAYDRHSSAHYEYGAELVRWRPGMKEAEVWNVLDDGAPLLSRDDVEAAIAKAKKHFAAKHKLEAVFAPLDNLVATCEDLPQFEIVDD